VVAAVLDENATDLGASQDRARQVEVRDIGLQSLGIVGRHAVGTLETDPGLFEEREIRLVADQRKDGVGADRETALRTVDEHRVGSDLEDPGAEDSPDRSGADAIFQIRLDPVLHTVGDRVASSQEGDAGAVAVEIERGFGRRVLRADDDHVAVVKRIGRNKAPVDVR